MQMYLELGFNPTLYERSRCMGSLTRKGIQVALNNEIGSSGKLSYSNLIYHLDMGVVRVRFSVY